MSAGLLPYLIATIFAASLVQSATGFGYALVAVGALSLVAPLETTTPLVALLSLPVTSYLFWRLRRAVDWSELGPLIAGTLVGVPFGVLVLVKCPQDVLLRILGAILVAVAVRSAFAARAAATTEARTTDSMPLLRLAGFMAGAASGALGGAFNASGPPLIAYVYSRPWSKEQRTGALQALFVINIVSRIPIMASIGLYDRAVLTMAAAAIPAGLLGMAIGVTIFRRFPSRGLEVFVAVSLLAIGAKLLISP